MSASILPPTPDPLGVINRAPDDSRGTRAIKREGWALYLGLTLAFFAVMGSLGVLLSIQAREETGCQEQIEGLREEWQAGQALLLAQLNDRLDSQGADMVLCRNANERLQGQIRALEVEFREKLEQQRAQILESQGDPT